jgi:hypothetical protein
VQPQQLAPHGLITRSLHMSTGGHSMKHGVQCSANTLKCVNTQCRQPLATQAARPSSSWDVHDHNTSCQLGGTHAL